MKRSHSCHFDLLGAVAVLVGVMALTCGMFWGGGGEPSWAAPGQDPYLQTAPTRLPTATPAPPRVTPSAEPPTAPPKDDDEDGEDQAPPTPAPGPEDRPSPLPVEPQSPSTAAAPPGIPAPTGMAPAVETATATPPADTLATPALLAIDLAPEGDSTDYYLPILVRGNDTSAQERSPFASPLLPSAPGVASASIDGSDFLPAVALPPYRASLLAWLYALGLGAVLIVSGLFLINRS